MKITRKTFLRTTGLGLAGAAIFKSTALTGKGVANAGKLNFGIASYSFREFSLGEVIRMTQRLGIKHIGLKSMHMPLESSLEEIKQISNKVRQEGMDLYGAGVIYMNSEDEVNITFEYARAAGIRVIIGVPKHNLLPLVNTKVREYDIIMAIHNHGPGDEQYSSPDDVFEKIQGLDERIGLCLDIGHTFRIGQDPVQMARKYANRLYDVHFKDIDKEGAEGANIECGRGVMDLPAFLQTLLELNYQGVVAFEYEKDGADPLPGAAESVGYARGVLDVIV